MQEVYLGDQRIERIGIMKKELLRLVVSSEVVEEPSEKCWRSALVFLAMIRS